MITFMRPFELPGWTGLKISGRIDAFIDKQLIQSIEEAIGNSNRVALDLSETEFLSLQMLKFFTHLNQVLGRKGGELALVRPSHNVRRQIEIFIGMKVFAVYQSKEDLQTGFHVQPRAEFQTAPTERLFS
jgi:anti-anti-sigma factor